MKTFIAILTVAISLLILGCKFSEYAQTEKLTENIDSYRTGCEVDTNQLLVGYMQYEANEYYYGGVGGTPEPTPTPEPVSNTELSMSILLEQVWEHGCNTGRRDTVGSEQATLMSLRDQLNIMDSRIAALEPPTPTPTVVAVSTPPAPIPTVVVVVGTPTTSRQ